jgi:hypothetical protein
MISDEKREMASAGTLLSDLGNGAPDGDNDLVQRILADLNTTESPSNPVMSPPAGNGRVISSPNPNTTYPLAMDPATATAHMIGKTYPTPGDFANMMGPGPAGAPYSGGQQQQYPQQQQQQQPILASLYGGGKGWMADLMTQIRQPLLVAILVFVMSLPVINVMLAFYLPSLLRATGELSTVGLLAKSLLAGALYWTILNVVAPLVSN